MDEPKSADAAASIAQRDAQLAQWLLQQHATRQPFTPLNDRIATIDDAYRVQRAFLNALVASQRGPESTQAVDAASEAALRAYQRALSTDSGGEIAGYKVGLTTPRMQAMCGISEPIAGTVLASRVYRPDAHVRASDYVRLGVESEICVAFGSDLPRNCTRADVAARIRSVQAAFELIEDRGASYAALDARSLIADNSWNAGVVVGEPGDGDIDLETLSGRLSINGQQVDSGSSADAMGHPLDVVVWLAHLLERQGSRLRAGQFVMTGSLVPTRFASAGQTYRLDIDGLPAVAMTIDT